MRPYVGEIAINACVCSDGEACGLVWADDECIRALGFVDYALGGSQALRLGQQGHHCA